jgi:hypothetical protein
MSAFLQQAMPYATLRKKTASEGKALRERGAAIAIEELERVPWPPHGRGVDTDQEALQPTVGAGK